MKTLFYLSSLVLITATAVGATPVDTVLSGSDPDTWYKLLGFAGAALLSGQFALRRVKMRG